MKILLGIAAAVLFQIPNAYCQDDTDTTDRRNIVSSLKAEVEKLNTTYEEKIAQLDAAYSAKVEARRKDAIKKLESLQKNIAAVNLDEAIAIRETVKELDTNVPTPPRRMTSSQKAETTHDRSGNDQSTIAKLRAEILTKNATLKEISEQLAKSKAATQDNEKKITDVAGI